MHQKKGLFFFWQKRALSYRSWGSFSFGFFLRNFFWKCTQDLEPIGRKLFCGQYFEIQNFNISQLAENALQQSNLKIINIFFFFLFPHFSENHLASDFFTKNLVEITECLRFETILQSQEIWRLLIYFSVAYKKAFPWSISLPF